MKKKRFKKEISQSMLKGYVFSLLCKLYFSKKKKKGPIQNNHNNRLLFYYNVHTEVLFEYYTLREDPNAKHVLPNTVTTTENIAYIYGIEIMFCSIFEEVGIFM